MHGCMIEGKSKCRLKNKILMGEIPLWTKNIHFKNKGQECKTVPIRVGC
jgi:hypothetical protein